MSWVYCDPKSRTMIVWWLTKGLQSCDRASPLGLVTGLEKE